MSSERIKLSIALVTRNRLESLSRALSSWRAQTIQPDEIVVSDDSDEAVAPGVRNIVLRHSCSYVRGPQRGLYANRNSAALACEGTHIMSADDDHTHPLDFVAVVLNLIRQDPARVWTFGERNPLRPHGRLGCPTELHRSGAGCAPRDPSNSAAIADGASVYPRGVFDSGLRYDETYPFGSMWYLWGKVLRRHGWRISFSDSTHIWHHEQDEPRFHDKRFLEKQLCCNTYVIFVHALFVSRRIQDFAWSVYYLLRRMVLGDSIHAYHVRTRISLPSALKLLRNVARARKSYRRFGASQA